MNFIEQREFLTQRGNRDPFEQAWFEGTPLSEELQSEPVMQDKTGFTLFYRGTGMPVLCHICHENGKWLPEGGDGVPAIFVCEHEPLEFPPIRQISTVRASGVYAQGGGAIEEK